MSALKLKDCLSVQKIGVLKLVWSAIFVGFVILCRFSLLLVSTCSMQQSFEKSSQWHIRYNFSCRKDELIQQLLLTAHREQKVKLCSHFLRQWKHYESVGLPNHEFCNQKDPPQSSLRIIRAARKYMLSVASLKMNWWLI